MRPNRQHLIDLRQRLPCQISRGCRLTMTKTGFETACKSHHQKRRGADAGKRGLSQCDVCAVSKSIKKKISYDLPSEITIVPIDRLVVGVKLQMRMAND